MLEPIASAITRTGKLCSFGRMSRRKSTPSTAPSLSHVAMALRCCEAAAARLRCTAGVAVGIVRGTYCGDLGRANGAEGWDRGTRLLTQIGKHQSSPAQINRLASPLDARVRASRLSAQGGRTSPPVALPYRPRVHRPGCGPDRSPVRCAAARSGPAGPKPAPSQVVFPVRSRGQSQDLIDFKTTCLLTDKAARRRLNV